MVSAKVQRFQLGTKIFVDFLQEVMIEMIVILFMLGVQPIDQLQCVMFLRTTQGL